LLTVAEKVVLAPAQIVFDKGWVEILGEGFTVIVNVIGAPEQVVPKLVYLGVTVIVAVIGALVVLVAVKEGIFPVPDEASPIEG